MTFWGIFADEVVFKWDVWPHLFYSLLLGSLFVSPPTNIPISNVYQIFLPNQISKYSQMFTKYSCFNLVYWKWNIELIWRLLDFWFWRWKIKKSWRRLDFCQVVSKKYSHIFAKYSYPTNIRTLLPSSFPSFFSSWNIKKSWRWLDFCQVVSEFWIFGFWILDFGFLVLEDETLKSFEDGWISAKLFPKH